ncbi:MAG TPA: hypothetical protein VIT88_02215 [Pyrinomonadaceae bacterium]
MRLFLILGCLLLLLLPEVSVAATRYAVATGNWNSTSTWSATPGGAAGASVPGNGDDVVLVFVNGPGPVTVTVTANASCNSIDIQNPATAGDNVLFINNGVTLTVIGNVDVHGDHTLSGSTRDAKLIINGGTLTVGGNLTIGCHNNQEATFDLSNGTDASSVVNVAGNFTNTIANRGKFIPGTNSTINFNGSSPQVININNVIKSYANIAINNPAGVTLTTPMGATQLTGNLRVQSGVLYSGGLAITGSGGTFEVANGARFVLTGTSEFPTGFGTITLQATSTVDYAGSTQTVAARNYGNLTISAGSSPRTVTLASAGTVGVFTNFTPSSTNNTYVITGSTVEFNGNLPQTLPSNFSSYHNLKINNISGSGVTLEANTTVNSTLTFTSGTVTTGSSSLYLASGGTVSRASGHVVGNFKKFIATGATSKTFEVGDASNYTPVTVSFASVTTAGDLTASDIAGDHPNISSSNINSSKSVNRYWTLTNSGIVFTNYSATFNFVSGDVDSGANTNAFVVGKHTSGTWSYPTVGTKTSNSTQAIGLTAFSDFQIGESGPPNVVLANSVVPSGTQPPSTELVYTVTFTNSGSSVAQAFIITDPIPANTDFKVGSVTTNLGTTGLSATVAYSNDGGITWTYTPVSGAGGAPAGYDRTLTNIRWTFTGNLSQTAPNNSGSVGFTVLIH